MKITRLSLGVLDTNCYIVSSEKGNAFIIDPADSADEIKDALRRDDLAAKFIVNTHGHIDHIKADAVLSLPVYIHSLDAEIISDPQKNHMISFFGGFEPVVPERLLEEGDLIKLDELTFKVIHTPGHTHGCICIYGEGVLFSGDTLFKNGIGRTDIPRSSATDMENSLKKLSALDPDTVVYPGHGPKTSIRSEFFD